MPLWPPRRVPTILQTEATECGLACIAMVASYWGHRTTINTLRRRFASSLRGTTLREMVMNARLMGLAPRPVKVGLKALPKLSLPCILHWRMEHFVVLTEVGAASVKIVDPALGSRRIPMEEFSEQFTGVALELTPGEGFQHDAGGEKTRLRQLTGEICGVGRGVAQLVGLGLLLECCVLLMPFQLQRVVDEAVPISSASLAQALGVAFLLLVAMQTGLRWVRSRVSLALSAQLCFQWMGNAMSHLLRLPIPFFEKRHLGDIVSRFGSIQTVQRALTAQLAETVVDGLLVIGAFVAMYLYSPTLSATALVALAIYVAVRLFSYRPLQERAAEQLLHSAQQQTTFLESVRGIQSIRVFGRTEERRIRWLNELASQFNSDTRFHRLGALVQATRSGVFTSQRVVAIWVGALYVLDARMTVGVLFAFLAYNEQFSERAASLLDKLFEISALKLHMDRLADIMCTSVEEDRPIGTAPTTSMTALAASIDLVDLRYRYSDTDPELFSGLTVHIPEGQFVAIVGESGCGKTTLLKILLGLFPPSSGEIRLGGCNILELGIDRVREIFGAVMQEDHLFSGTIAENISFFSADADQLRIEHCARLASIHNDIGALPMAYRTHIGDLGSGLSGGQRQRILLARALYHQPRLLVLDEATSHLDLKNERNANKALAGLPLTRIVVAHRPETIRMADRVIGLGPGGRLVFDLAIQDYLEQPCRAGPRVEPHFE